MCSIIGVQVNISPLWVQPYRVTDEQAIVLIGAICSNSATANSTRMKEKEKIMREKQKDNADSLNRFRELTPLSPKESVWVTHQQARKTVD